MKKVLAIVLMLTMVLSVVGCQANGNNDVEPTQAPEASAVPPPPRPARGSCGLHRTRRGEGLRVLSQLQARGR